MTSVGQSHLSLARAACDGRATVWILTRFGIDAHAFVHLHGRLGKVFRQATVLSKAFPSFGALNVFSKIFEEDGRVECIRQGYKELSAWVGLQTSSQPVADLWP